MEELINCPYCGTKLKTTSWDNKFCPNCGIIQENEELSKESDEKPSYIG